MNDAQLLINRVPFDPRREQRGPSEQWVTVWPISEAPSVLQFIERCKPQGVCLHGRARDIVANRRLGERLRSRFPGLKLAAAIAGDWDNPREPGYTDGWEDAARMCLAERYEFLQLNCEVAWKSRPKGSGDTALAEVKAAAPGLPLWHTSYGAPANVDRDLVKPGHQGFGGHSGGSLWEFVDDPGDVEYEAPQIYWGTSDGEYKDRASQLVTADAYARSIAKARETKRIDQSIPIAAYLQVYNCRVDGLCYTSEWYAKTQWWAVGTSSRVDDAGRIAVAVLSELYRRGLSVEQFQAQMGLTVDGWVGPKTYAALLPDAPWKHPQTVS